MTIANVLCTREFVFVLTVEVAILLFVYSACTAGVFEDKVYG